MDSIKSALGSVGIFVTQQIAKIRKAFLEVKDEQPDWNKRLQEMEKQRDAFNEKLLHPQDIPAIERPSTAYADLLKQMDEAKARAEDLRSTARGILTDMLNPKTMPFESFANISLKGIIGMSKTRGGPMEPTLDVARKAWEEAQKQSRYQEKMTGLLEQIEREKGGLK